MGNTETTDKGSIPRESHETKLPCDWIVSWGLGGKTNDQNYKSLFVNIIIDFDSSYT
jgi:hypothetical protein